MRVCLLAGWKGRGLVVVKVAWRADEGADMTAGKRAAKRVALKGPEAVDSRVVMTVDLMVDLMAGSWVVRMAG